MRFLILFFVFASAFSLKNKNFNQLDINKLSLYLTSQIELSKCETKKYDVNKDEMITSLDLLYIKRIIENGGI